MLLVLLFLRSTEMKMEVRVLAAVIFCAGGAAQLASAGSVVSTAASDGRMDFHAKRKEIERQGNVLTLLVLYVVSAGFCL